MLQRIQSIWLFLAAVLAFSTLKLSFYSGTNELAAFEKLNGLSTIPVMILTIGVGVISLVAIFLYSNRPLQIKLCLLSGVLQVLVLVLLISETNKFTQGTFSLTAVIYAAILIFIFLAFKGIKKDERIVKESNRLR